MDLQLRGKRVLVTGGSRGIGFACAEVFAEEGAHLHLASRTAADLEAAKARLRARHAVEVRCHPCDLSRREDAVALARAAGEIDILVNNAGAIPHGPIAAFDDAQWRAAWELKLYGFINLTREVYGEMTGRGAGVIVNVMGTAAVRPTASYIIGSTANASLDAFTRALGADGVDHGVRVVGVHPGATETDRQVVRWKARAKEQLGDENRWRELTTGFPFGRLATAREVANVVVFLASAAASYVTGTVVTVDGARSLRQ